MGKSIVSSIGEEDFSELSAQAGNILRLEIIDALYEAGLSDYDDDYEEDDDSPSQRLYG
uniref:Uncharacterized protein n=1 Tax=Panagrolaimus sp. PS1159 TaxID=55785 RepID=A0AC35F5H9_9BILA